MDIREYAKKVQECRDLQRRYFKAARTGQAGRQEALELSKDAEKELDVITAEIISGKLLEQINLF